MVLQTSQSQTGANTSTEGQYVQERGKEYFQKMQSKDVKAAWI